MNPKLRISAVSYLNTIPFVYGLRKHESANMYSISLDVPSECARKLRDKEADIALIPVAALKDLNQNYHIISDYCIGAEGRVKTVLLVGNQPIERVKKIFLDPDSMTSIQLIRVLAKEHWKIQPEWVEDTKLPIDLSDQEAMVMIGDKTFHIANQFEYVYDLAEAWKDFTHLPFVFACWVSNRKLDLKELHYFNQAILFGVENKKAAIENSDIRQQIDLTKYLNDYISFEFDSKKKDALKLFLAKI